MPETTPHTAPILAAFARAKAAAHVALIPYVMAGYPDLETSEALAVALGEAGADILELGVPFSDPQADGATIQAAGQCALDQGMTLVGALALAGRITAWSATPLVLMTYYNPIFSYGLARFCQAAAAAGVAGLIVPDLPPEEATLLREAAKSGELALVFLVAPTSTDARIERIAQAAEANGRGFLYCVSLSGVTGARDHLPEHLAAFVARVRARARLPLAVGFGVSRAEHVAEIARIADGAVVASALLNAVDAAPPTQRVQAAVDFLRGLRESGEGAVDLD
ncbi:MAG: tryptophan synthase subunit alpha [Ktedonobacterales bacterium]|nr:tryptophan synthase subunit alpha [Ktedonobacterales bacterium]